MSKLDTAMDTKANTNQPAERIEVDTPPAETKEQKERRRNKAIADLGFWQYVDPEEA